MAYDDRDSSSQCILYLGEETLTKTYDLWLTIIYFIGFVNNKSEVKEDSNQSLSIWVSSTFRSPSSRIANCAGSGSPYASVVCLTTFSSQPSV